LNLLYWIVKPLANVFMRVYYKFDYKGLEKVPFGKPVVLAPNHVNAFIDPVIIAMNPPQKVRFFARGDVFKGKMAAAMLDSLNISPMYRIQEGYAELKKNDKTFEECRKLLSANKTILMFPEGICVQERRLRPLKKGMARIVFQTAESMNFERDVLVVPVGLNYSDAKRFRSKIFIDFGDAVSVKEYEARYKEDRVKAINEFTRQFEEKMSRHLVIIENKENDELFAALEEIYLRDWIAETDNGKDLERHYQASRDMATMVNYLDREKPEMIALLKEKTGKYIKKINKHQLRDHLLDPEKINKMHLGTFLLEYLIIYLGMPFYILGLVMNYPPYYIAKTISDTKIKNVEFYASVYGNIAMLLWLVYYGLQLLTVALVFRSWPLLLVYAVLVPLSGRYLLRFYPRMKKIFGRWRLLRLVRKERKVVEELVNERSEIIEILSVLKAEFKERNK
jgi:glycerol-3-phosphate O-acyltransferase / dihydroxyacetone phosphate acyltransferase